MARRSPIFQGGSSTFDAGGWEGIRRSLPSRPNWTWPRLAAFHEVDTADEQENTGEVEQPKEVGRSLRVEEKAVEGPGRDPAGKKKDRQQPQGVDLLYCTKTGCKGNGNILVLSECPQRQQNADCVEADGRCRLSAQKQPLTADCAEDREDAPKQVGAYRANGPNNDARRWRDWI